MRFADARARFNRRVVNRVVRPISGRFAMWSIIEHRGRRSGTVYRTPVSVFPTPDGVAILLAYGEDRDWVRNLMAADGGRVTMSGETFAVVDPRIVPTRDAAALLDSPWRQMIGLMRTPTALLLRRA
ncbi:MULTISPECIES: nitroreductase family deazaflavin-dependent oxidoreductase [unclassified Mycolicibacterium]|uniref:nitroreductase family deazaflavin-dependent oxidoreductase n=1 Tax=unclassified Mycolicibacterium TaxID=2636767 RepID=UPI001F4C1B30|nr:nitroreductase family deazaflavin-dependent oxidoreductase [Mycolicibacterium sp. YH-1]UNB51695.1 nitroreductase family deazaflavin-dependent oxidoreductase [Mycolicibacterium sp. YH-1]